ncbi:MAG: GNAT family protein [Erysipelotrichaceae bacterium]
MDIKIREWQQDDVASLAKVANNAEIAANLRDVFPNPYTKKDAEFFIALAAQADKNFILMYAIEIDGKAVGSISVSLIDEHNTKSGEIGFWLGKKYWNKGYMTEAIKQVSALAFKKFDIIRIDADVFEHNTASRVALQNAGFVWEGTMRKAIFKDGKYLDKCIYGLLK